MQSAKKYFRFISLNFLTLLALTLSSGNAAAYTLQDLLDADRDILYAQQHLAEVQNGAPSYGAGLVRISDETNAAIRGCTSSNAGPDAVRECLTGVADDYDRAIAELQDTLNQYWFELADAEVAVTNAVSAYNVIYTALYG